jgi:hypothetical protein
MGAHSGNNMATVVQNTLQKFGVLTHAVGYFVLDNASNNDSAVTVIGEKMAS